MSIPVVLLMKMHTIPVLSVSTVLLCILLAAMMQCVSFTQKWTDSVFTVQVVMGVVSMGICLLYAYAVSRNSTAFASIALPAGAAHAAALLACIVQKIMTDRKKG